MMPLINENQYKCIFKQTVIPQIIAARLWQALGFMRATHHLRCVGLLHHLHNIVPKPKSIEKIIAKDLNNVDTYQRFTLLWHLSRDLEVKTKDQSRTFDICLLKMLDTLNMSGGPLKVLSQSWLVHAMTRGDVGRIMEPLFLTLLDPCTARLSVLHCSLNMLEENVFAIAFDKDGIDGAGAQDHVIFHVINNGDKSTSLKQYSKRAESPTKTSTCRRTIISDLGTLSIDINPFALVPPHLDDYDNYTKGYTNDSSSSSSATSTPSMMSLNDCTSQVIIGPIIEELLDAVMLETSDNVDKGLTPAGVHPLHSHLLLYTQVCDARQVLYTLECIKNVLKSNARLSICALSTTNLNSKPSARSHQVQILLAR